MKSDRSLIKSIFIPDNSRTQIFVTILKGLISVAILFYVGYQIADRWGSFLTAFLNFRNSIFIVIVVLVMMPLNWFMEVLKWKQATKNLTPISYRLAWKTVLSGMSLGFITPYSIGDYLARIYSFPLPKREKLLGNIMLVRGIQNVPTLLFGFIAILYAYYYLGFSFPLSSSAVYKIGSILIVISLLLLVLMNLTRVKNKIIYFIEWTLSVQRSTILYLTLLSMGRYLIFSIQLMLLLNVFDLPLSNFEVFLGIAFMFLAKSVIPSLNLFSDLGVREFSIMVYFQLYQVEIAPVLAASLLLWLINIIIPASIGAFFISGLKVDRK